MNLGSLKPAPGGAVKDTKRLGRGNASGQGGTAGRGHKGYMARSGAKVRPWAEGGTMPIYRRLPKKGFTNIFKEEYQVINLDLINRMAENEISVETLFARGFIKSLKKPVKILANGTLERAVTVTANAFSKSAIEKIEAAGGKAQVL